MKTFTSIFRQWIPLAASITLVSGIICLALQQNCRQAANDPQYQMAWDAANALDDGADPNSLVPGTPVEMTRCISPYLVIYDGKGQPLATGALLRGKTPVLPAGVLDYVRKKGEDMVTWRPPGESRQALVVKKTTGSHLYFAAAGRSLRTTEIRTGRLTNLVAFGWLCSITIVFAIISVLDIISTGRTGNN